MEIQKLPPLVPVSPEMVHVDIKATWNNEQVREYLLKVTERYKNLVVTDENREDMEKTLREIVKLRTSLKSFKTKGMRQLKDPATNFGYEVDALMNIVSDVEEPLREQLNVYEEKRQEELSKKIDREIELKAKAAGLREEFFNEFVSDGRWYNKTYKWSQICKDIDEEISRLSEVQRLSDERRQLIAERREMANEYISLANKKYALKTALTKDFISDTDLVERTLPELKEMIYSTAEKQHEIEIAAIRADEQPKELSEEAVQEILQEDVHNDFMPDEKITPMPEAEDTVPGLVEVMVQFHAVPEEMLDTLYEQLDEIGIRYDVKAVQK